MSGTRGFSDAQRRALNAIGIDVWVLRDEVDSDPAEPATDPVVNDKAGPTDQQWRELECQVAACTRCRLHATRTQTVFGVGNRRAEWMLIGEAPGLEEDRQGEPFVGQAGQLLNRMLLAIGLRREDVYIANILKCRPPENRNPRADEVESCADYLRRQIAWVAPRLVLAVGGIAAKNLLGTDAPVGRLRGRVHDLPGAGVPLVVTYHPAYLLRSPAEKAKVWQDLCFARTTVGAMR